MPAIATYPGSISPLRGLSPFSESEREVFFGRDSEVQALSHLVTSAGFRAGLVHGETGVGKTSLIHAGLVPHLRDHGVVAVVCRDIHRPTESLAGELATASGAPPAEQEQPLQYLSRMLESGVPGQLFLFVLDDVDVALAASDESCAELANLYARLVTRSSGRARFLFVCASESVYRLSALEQRTGSLFPPSSRYELARLDPAGACTVLERTLALAGVAADAQLARVAVELLAQDGAILPAELQIAALGLLQLGVTSPEALQRVGGAAELERAWLKAAAAATGDERAGLRLLGELAGEPRPPGGCTADWAAARASVSIDVAAQALAELARRGIAREVPGERGTHYLLAHALLLPRVREVAAPAREASRRAFELLGSKAASGRRLTLAEYWALRREGLAPATAQERTVIERTRKAFLIAGATAAAAPLLVLVVIYVVLIGSSYLDVAVPAEGGGPRVVVRAGRPGLQVFHWLPASPSFGSVIADTGFTRPMVEPDAWSRAASKRARSGRDGYAGVALAALQPPYRHILEYATRGTPAALDELQKFVTRPEDLVALLEQLRPIARGSDAEIAFVESALKDPSPAVQRSALRVAADAARRRPGLYHTTLARALTSSDAELRRLAMSAAQALGADTALALFRAALAESSEPAARRELLAVITAAETAQAPTAESTASILANRDLPPSTRERAREQLRRAFASDAAAAAATASRLAADSRVPPEDRVLALTLLRELAPDGAHAGMLDPVKAALAAEDEAVRAAALPLFARIAPAEGAAELVVLFEDKQLGEELRKAMALGWGEVARATKDRAAAAALATLVEDASPVVRAAAAEAYGNTGRAAQETLLKMVKTDRFEVAVGAAYGLAHSVSVGASPGPALNGLTQLWRKKGKPRRVAAEVFAHLPHDRVPAVLSYLSSAARAPDDAGLRVIGTRGLCKIGAAGNKNARRVLARGAEDSAAEVRRAVMECIADDPGDLRASAAVASRLVADADAAVRVDAARVLAAAAADDKLVSTVAAPLVKLGLDDEREVRLLAIRALAGMGAGAPDDAGKALTRAFDRADEAEKQALLEAARALGAVDLVRLAIADPLARVRVAALDTSLAGRIDVAATLNAALTDRDRNVRVAALERLAASKDALDAGALARSLDLAVLDPDPAIAQLALTTLARVGELDEVLPRLERALGQVSERERAQAAHASIGVAERDPARATRLLEPLLDDPSHDVRAAMMPALAMAWSATLAPDKLAALLERSERHPMRRIVVTAAFLTLAQAEDSRDAALAALARVAASGPPLARVHAALGAGLIDGQTSGMAFLQLIAP